MNRRLFLFGALGAAVPLPAIAGMHSKMVDCATLRAGVWELHRFPYEAAVKNGWLTKEQARRCEESFKAFGDRFFAKEPPVTVCGTSRQLDRELGVTRRAAVVDRPASRESILRAMERAKDEAVAEIRKGPRR